VAIQFNTKSILNTIAVKMKESKNKNEKRYPESLGKFSISNFRVFETETSFDFKPLTFLVGPNSSGKSSLMKLLKTINQSSQRNKNYFIPQRISDSFEINSTGIHFSNSLPKQNDTFTFSMDLSHFFNGLKIRSDLNYLKSKNKNGLDISVYKLFWQEISIFQIEYLKPHGYKIELNYSALINMSSAILERDFEAKKKHNESSIFSDDLFSDTEEKDYLIMLKEGRLLFESNMEHTTQNDYIKKIQDLFFKQTENLKVDTTQVHSLELNLLIERNYFNDFGDNGLKSFFKYVFKLIENTISNNYKEVYSNEIELKLSQLGKFYCDVLPSRLQKAQVEFLDKKISFNHVPVFKRERTNIFDLNSNNTTSFDLIIKSYILRNRDAIKDGIIPSNDYIDLWLKNFNIGNTIVITSLHPSNQYFTIEILLNNGKLISISDLGYGAGQVLSYILLPFFGEIQYSYEDTERNKKNIRKIHFNHFEKISGAKIPTINIYLEEPETNLHPNWQSILAELFAYQIKIGIRFVIETHSEYFVRKIQNLIAKKECDKKDVVIYYFNSDKNVDETKGEPKVKNILITETGGLTDNFGSGFFDEAYILKSNLLKLNKHQSN
jgi:predicted ATPase